jgi:PAS domain S-box-containing protein
MDTGRMLHKRSFLRLYATPLIVAGIGLTLSIQGFITIHGQVSNERRALFADAARERMAVLQSALDMYDLTLRSLRSFYVGSEYVSRQEFGKFTDPLVRKGENIDALVWLPAVNGDDRARVEQEAKTSGAPGFEIARFDEQGLRVRADDRIEYIPALYMNPLAGNELLLGVDWSSFPEIKEALDRARDRGMDVTVRLPASARPGDVRTALATIVPVYGKGAWAPSVENRRKNLEGFLAEVYKPEEIQAARLSAKGDHRVVLEVAMIEDRISGTVLFDRGLLPAGGPLPDDGMTISDIDGLPYGVAAVGFGGADWTVVASVGSGLSSLSKGWLPWLVLVTGVGLTAALVVYLIYVKRSSAEISWYADELRATQTELERRLSAEVVTKKTLHERERYLNVIFDTVATGIVVIDPESRTVVDANRAATMMLGMQRDLLVGTACRNLVCPAWDGQCPVMDLGRIIDRADSTFRNAAGEEVPCLKTVVPITLKGKKHLMECFTDISAQKRMQDAAERESARLSAMISGMEEGVVFADAKNVVTRVNDYFSRFVGMSSGDILGRNIGEFHPDGVMSHLNKLIDGFRSSVKPEPFTMQRRLCKADVILRMQPIYRGGLYDGVLLNVVDVSELVAARRKAEEATRTKSEFLANMSHEIRTPMTAVMGYADLLADPDLEEQDRREYLGIITRNGAHLLAVINDILDISKIEAGKLTLEMGKADILETVAEVVSMMRVRARERNTDLATEFPTSLPRTMVTDRARLRQVLVNLIGNAIKFTEGGSVHVRVSLVSEWRSGEPAVRFEVIDTGIGIDKAKIHTLFDPFVQADSSTSRRYGGTGLGLTISARIVDLLHGEISASSEPGKGSTFVVTLPAGDLEGVEIMDKPGEALLRGRAVSHASPVTTDALRGLRIMVAEDGPDNQRLIRTLLSKAGANVTLVEDGSAAVGAASGCVFDMILMDLQMPKMDGYQATRTIRAQGCKVPILALTAHTMSADRAKCLAAGFDDHLAKPIKRDELIAKVAQWARAEGRRDSRSSSTPTECGGAVSEQDVGVILSELADDPDLAGILTEFVSCMPERIISMKKALAGSDLEQVRRLAHRLKGAGGSYGYARLTDVAADIESACQDRNRDKAAQGLELLERVSEAMIAGLGEPAGAPAQG